jgi:hypothetical protein
MSAAARPKIWGASRQAKGREFDHIKVQFSPSLTGFENDEVENFESKLVVGRLQSAGGFETS